MLKRLTVLELSHTMPHVASLCFLACVRRRYATHEVFPSLFMFRRVIFPGRKSVFRATAATAGQSCGKAKRRKEAARSRRESCSDEAFVENRRAGDQIHRDGRHHPLE